MQPVTNLQDGTDGTRAQKRNEVSGLKHSCQNGIYRNPPIPSAHASMLHACRNTFKERQSIPVDYQSEVFSLLGHTACASLAPCKFLAVLSAVTLSLLTIMFTFLSSNAGVQVQRSLNFVFSLLETP